MADTPYDMLARSALPPNQGVATMLPPGGLPGQDAGPGVPLGSSAFSPGAPPGAPPDQTAHFQSFADKYSTMFKSVQDRRRKTEDEWLLNLSAWKAQHRRQAFRGEWFNHYVPAARNAVEKFVTRVKQMLCPSPDFFEVFPADDKRHDLGIEAESWKNYLLWRLRRNKIRSLVAQLVRCYCIYQRCVAKTYLDFEDVPGQAWPSVRVVDPFTFYVWPETAVTEPQMHVVFEHSMMSYERYSRLAEQGAALPIAVGDITKPEWPTYYIERLNQAGMSAPTDVRTGGPAAGNAVAGDPEKMISLTEGWRRDGATWTQFWIVWNCSGGPKCVRVNPGQIFPYHIALARALPGEHYTNGMMSDLEPLNVILNDQMNMTLEGQATSILPPAIIDPDAVARHDSIVFRPRAKWLMRPDGVKWMDTPNTMGTGFQGMQMSQGMIASYSGSNPLAEGQPQRGMPRAGFAVSSMIGLSMGDIRDVAEILEDHILTPLLQAMARLTIQGGLPQQQIAEIPGAEALSGARYSIAQLVGGYSFEWVGSLQFQDQNVRAQRMLTALGQLAKIHPAMEKAGYTLDFPVIGKRLWRHGIGERGADTIIIPQQPPQPEPPRSEPPKISVSLRGEDLGPQLSQALALQGSPELQGGPQGPPPGPGMPGQPGMPPQPPQGPQGAPGGLPPGVHPGDPGGMNAPAPASAEAAERQIGRGMSESTIGAQLAGTGPG